MKYQKVQPYEVLRKQISLLLPHSLYHCSPITQNFSGALPFTSPSLLSRRPPGCIRVFYPLWFYWPWILPTMYPFWQEVCFLIPQQGVLNKSRNIKPQILRALKNCVMEYLESIQCIMLLKASDWHESLHISLIAPGWDKKVWVQSSPNVDLSTSSLTTSLISKREPRLVTKFKVNVAKRLTYVHEREK